MKTIACPSFAVIVSAVAVAQADPPKLVDEAVVMEVDSCMPHGIPWIVRMSPDGELLLFAKAPSRSGHAHQVLLRHWRTREEKAVPIPWFADPTDFWCLRWWSMNPFSADSKLLVVPAGVDEDNNRWIGEKEKLEPAVYDIERGKLQRIGLGGHCDCATFDAAGRHLLFTVRKKDAQDGSTYVAPVDTLRPKRLAAWGLPLAPRPGHTTCVFIQADTLPEDGQVRPKFVLYDYLKDREVPGRPFCDWNAPLSSPVLLGWSADGRYFYCSPGIKQITTHVWDIQEGKQVARLPDYMPIGPCGGQTTIVLGKFGGFFPGLLHDARTGSQEPLSDSMTIHPICTAGKYVLYERKNDHGNHILCRAEVQTGQSAGRPGSGPSNQGR